MSSAFFFGFMTELFVHLQTSYENSSKTKSSCALIIAKDIGYKPTKDFLPYDV